MDRRRGNAGNVSQVTQMPGVSRLPRAPSLGDLVVTLHWDPMCRDVRIENRALEAHQAPDADEVDAPLIYQPPHVSVSQAGVLTGLLAGEQDRKAVTRRLGP